MTRNVSVARKRTSTSPRNGAIRKRAIKTSGHHGKENVNAELKALLESLQQDPKGRRRCSAHTF